LLNPQIKAPSSEGLPPAGYVIATDIASGKRMWTAKVYETTIDPNREMDVQLVFFRSLALGANGDFEAGRADLSHGISACQRINRIRI